MRIELLRSSRRAIRGRGSGSRDRTDNVVSHRRQMSAFRWLLLEVEPDGRGPPTTTTARPHTAEAVCQEDSKPPCGRLQRPEGSGAVERVEQCPPGSVERELYEELAAEEREHLYPRG